MLDEAPSTVGTYKLTAAAAETDLFARAEETREFSISKRPATLSLAARADEESESATVVATLSGGLSDLSGKKVRISFGHRFATTTLSPMADGKLVATSRFDRVAEGTYEVKASLSDENYSFTIVPAQLVVDYPEVSVRILGDPSKTYDGTPVSNPEVEATEGARVTLVYDAGATGNLLTCNADELDNSTTAPSEPGTYTVIATAVLGSRSATDAEEFTISPYDTDLYISANDKVTDGMPADVSCRIAARGVADPVKHFGEGGGTVALRYFSRENGTWTCLDEEPVEPGTYLVVAQASGDTYYTDAKAQTHYTIIPAPKQNTCIVIDAKSKVYDGNPAEVSAAATSEDGEALSLSIRLALYAKADDGAYGDAFYEAPSAIGSYHVVATTDGNENCLGHTTRFDLVVLLVCRKEHLAVPIDLDRIINLCVIRVYTANTNDRGHKVFRNTRRKSLLHANGLLRPIRFHLSSRVTHGL